MGPSSTIEHLPAEVLTHIFAHCIPTYPLKDNTGGQTTLERLEDVCMTWKAITTSTPHIWTTISIAYNANTTAFDFEQTFMSTKIFLQRSGRLPLRVSVIDLECSPNLDWEPLIRLLVEHSERWQCVHFEMSTWAHRFVNDSCTRNQLPSLDEVSLFVSNPQGDFLSSPYYPPVLPFGTSSGGLSLRPHHSALPWDQLVSWAGKLQAGEILQLLCACTRLRSCSIPSVTRCFGGPRLAMVENSSISHMTIELNGDSDQVLPYLSLPALTELTIVGTTREDGINASSPRLHVFLRGIKSLRRLQLREWSSTSQNDLIGLLSLTPEVVSLELEVTRGLTDGLLRGLTPIPGQVHILPTLEHLKCSGIVFFSEAHLHRFIVSRWRGSRRSSSEHMGLKSVQVYYYIESASQLENIKSQDGEESMRGLKANGFDISIALEDQVVL